MQLTTIKTYICEKDESIKSYVMKLIHSGKLVMVVPGKRQIE